MMQELDYDLILFGDEYQTKLADFDENKFNAESVSRQHSGVPNRPTLVRK